MNTITAKELRDNLGDLLMKADAGETFHVTYRSKIIATISGPDQNDNRYSGAEVGKRLENLIKELPDSISPMLKNPDKSYKELRDELYRRDPNTEDTYRQRALTQLHER